MKTFILLTKLSSDLMSNIKDRSKQGQSWMDEVKANCPDVKFLGHYALLGQYDFLDIYEAQDEVTAAKVSLISREFGATEAQSMSAIPYKSYLDLVKSLT